MGLFTKIGELADKVFALIAQLTKKLAKFILNNIRKEPLEKYWGIGVHNNCAVTEVEVKNAEAQILSENVTYYKETVRPWAGN